MNIKIEQLKENFFRIKAKKFTLLVENMGYHQPIGCMLKFHNNEALNLFTSDELRSIERKVFWNKEKLDK